ncbi:protein FAM222B-like [Archocentrus centrarchus]|uniref:protein FAM222B-like n=1 Tax=Archocentrus centrarchus TaxID=63155 RepID=UPI0011EA4E18|nr:protein FAM222B-like [Archocentrus centrarchus]
MLARLPASVKPTIRLLSRTQMNTGPPKWETTQKMRSASYPTPAELDAYAKKVANNPLTIQIFPSSVKVPQKKHIRRTVNGLDTSLSNQRQSSYSSQVGTSGGLLAVLRAPVKESDASHTRQLHNSVMNPHSGPYATESTLNHPQPAPQLQGPSQSAPQKQGLTHPQALQQQHRMTHPMALQQPHPQALQQRNMARSQAIQQQQSLSQIQTPQQQILAHPQGMQRQQSLPHTQALQQPPQQGQSCSSVVPQQHLSHLQSLKHQVAPPQALLSQQGVTQDLQRMSDGPQLPSLQHTQGLVGSQALPQPVAAGPPTIPNCPQQPRLGPYGPQKLPDPDAPPNITVSTSTIPLSMATSLHQNRPGDLSVIVHQINQLCQARAGMGTTSVCEGQIANPSPISRNLLINASSRVSSHHPALGNVPSAVMVGPPDKAAAQAPSVALSSQPSIAAANSMSAFHTNPEKVQQLHQHVHQQKQQQQQHFQQLQQLQQQRSWAQHQLSHMQQHPEGANPCKNPRMEPTAECAFPSRNLTYSHKLPNTVQSFPLNHPAEKPQPSSPVKCQAGSMPYINGHYMKPPWSSVPPTAGNNRSGTQDLSMAFQGGQAAATRDRIPGAKYRPGKEGPNDQSELMQNFLGGDFQMSNFQEQNVDTMGNIHRSARGQVQEPGSSSAVHAHRPRYC